MQSSPGLHWSVLAQVGEAAVDVVVRRVVGASFADHLPYPLGDLDHVLALGSPVLVQRRGRRTSCGGGGGGVGD